MDWIYYFIPACLTTAIVGSYLREAFKGDNMVYVDSLHKQYQVFDKNYNEVLVPLLKGIVLSMYTVVTSLVAIAFLFIAIFTCGKWWVPIVVYVGCVILANIPSVFTKLSYGSFLYYLYLIASPVLLVLSFVALFS